MKGRVKITQAKIKKEKRDRYIRIVFIVLGLCALFLALIAGVSRIDAIRIDSVIIEGNSRVSTELIRDTEITLRERGFLFNGIKRDNFFLYPGRVVREHIESISGVSHVDVARTGLREITISISEREAVAYYCRDAECFLVDEFGVVFSAVSERNSSSFIVYEDKTRTVALMEVISEQPQFKTISFFIRELEIMGIDIERVVFEDAGYIVFILRTGAYISIHKTDDITRVLETLQAFFLSDVVSSVETFTQELEYIRLDSGNKVFYKRR